MMTEDTANGEGEQSVNKCDDPPEENSSNSVSITSNVKNFQLEDKCNILENKLSSKISIQKSVNNSVIDELCHGNQCEKEEFILSFEKFNSSKENGILNDDSFRHCESDSKVSDFTVIDTTCETVNKENVQDFKSSIEESGKEKFFEENLNSFSEQNGTSMEKDIKSIEDDVNSGEVSNTSSTKILLENTLPVEQCVMQTVVAGTLQPFSFYVFDDSCSKTSIFDVEDSSTVDSFNDSSTAPSVDAHMSCKPDDAAEDLESPSLIDLSSCIQIDIADSSSCNEELVPASENFVEEEKPNVVDPISEIDEDEKSLILNIFPIKNGHGLWGVLQMKELLAEKGSILLRLCSAPEVADESVNANSTDFTAVMIDILEHELSSSKSSKFTDDALIESLNCGYSKDPVLNPVSTSNSLFKEWDGVKKKKQYKKNKYLHGGIDFVHLTRGGKKRGRPPLHNLHNRTSPNKTSFNKVFEDQSKYLSLSDSFEKSEMLSSSVCQGASVKIGNNAFSEVFSGTELEDNDDNDSLNFEMPIKKKLVRIECEYCSCVFRKKTALLVHIKTKHRALKRCHICNEEIRLKGQCGMNAHMLKMHRDNPGYECKECKNKFLLQQHLTNHIRLAHRRKIKNSMGPSDCKGEISDKSIICKDNVSDDKVCSEGDKIMVKNKKSDVHDNSDIENDSKSPKTYSFRGAENIRRNLMKSKKKDSGKESKNLYMFRNSRVHKRALKDVTVDDSEDDRDQDAYSLRTKKRNVDRHIVDRNSESSDYSESVECKKTLRSANSISLSKTMQLVSQPKLMLKRLHSDINIAQTNVKNISKYEESSSDSEVEEPKRYFCDKCGLGFSHKFKLKHHVKEKHVSFSQSMNLNLPSKDSDDEVNLNCSICGKLCRSKNQLRLHMVIHEYFPRMSGGANCKNDIQKQVTPNIKESDPSTSPVIKCDKNPEKLNSKISKKKPKVSFIVRKGRYYCCTKCNITFKKEKPMIYHMKKMHETIYPFKACDHCGKIFRSCGPYYRHIKQHDVLYCPEFNCKARYRNRFKMKQHQKISHPKKPHRCVKCVALFKDEKELVKHMEVDHSAQASEDEESGDDQDSLVDSTEVEVRSFESNIRKISTGNHSLSSESSDSSHSKLSRAKISSSKTDGLDFHKEAVPVTKEQEFLKTDKNIRKHSEFNSALSTSLSPTKDLKDKAKLEPVCSPKNIKVNEVIRPKKDRSWTAALKAKIKAGKVQNGATVKTTKTAKVTKKKLQQANIAARVVQRVAESLAKREHIARAISMSTGSRLPRVSFRSAAPQDNLSGASLNSCSNQSTARSFPIKNVPDHEDNDPGKVIRFDAF